MKSHVVLSEPPGFRRGINAMGSGMTRSSGCSGSVRSQATENGSRRSDNTAHATRRSGKRRDSSTWFPETGRELAIFMRAPISEPLPNGSNTPAVFMTEKAQAHEQEAYMRLGAVGVIPKPFDPMTLSDKLAEMWQLGSPSASISVRGYRA